MRRTLAVLVLSMAGCWSVDHVNEMGPVRYVVRTSPCGVCGSVDSTLETASGRTLVDHAWNMSRQHLKSPDGKRMLVVGWVKNRLHRLYLLDLTELKVVASADLPESNPDETSPAYLGPWSPDGRKVLIESVAPDGEETVFSVLTVDGLGLTPIHRDRHKMSARRAWSPDSAAVALVIGAGPKYSTAEGWRLLQIAPGPAREIGRIASLPLNTRIEWDGATPKIAP
jgi:hypothetical protein